MRALNRHLFEKLKGVDTLKYFLAIFTRGTTVISVVAELFFPESFPI